MKTLSLDLFSTLTNLLKKPKKKEQGIPAKVGIYSKLLILLSEWIPVCAGMTLIFTFSTGLLIFANATELDLSQEFDFSAPRDLDIHYYDMQSDNINYESNGKRSTVTYHLMVSCEPKEDRDIYTCGRFAVTFADNRTGEISQLEGWSHEFTRNAGVDEGGLIFGIPHESFTGLTTDDGRKLAVDQCYAVYNSFVDFHSFVGIFSRPIPGDNGIQNLKHIGDSIVHSAAFTEPPVHLGDLIEKGSVFRNGRITLSLSGCSLINNKVCAIIDYDSGASSFTMRLQPMPDMDAVVNGSSHYFGRIFIDINSLWVKKLTLSEFVVSETDIPSNQMKVPGITERQVRIVELDKQQYERRCNGE